MGSIGTKALMGVGTILNSIVFAGANLPYPFNYIVIGTAAILGIGVIADWRDWI